MKYQRQCPLLVHVANSRMTQQIRFFDVAVCIRYLLSIHPLGIPTYTSDNLARSIVFPDIYQSRIRRPRRLPHRQRRSLVGVELTPRASEQSYLSAATFARLLAALPTMNLLLNI